ncbi:hypothetical protein GGX14DRAFT_576268 [Mycena pura]|uniref:Uncharacterized protein n=1 Tax=Mycena pura TaxID=153505 RepID=A0AAD6Y1E3_9AGAR|nr:hypothetical protein GGX14DRAFT_576268 [Mycena pura]
MSRLPETPTHGRERNAARNQRLMDSPQHRRAPQQAGIQLRSAAADPFRNVHTDAALDHQQILGRLTRLPPLQTTHPLPLPLHPVPSAAAHNSDQIRLRLQELERASVFQPSSNWRPPQAADPGPSNRPLRLDAAEARWHLQELGQPLLLPANLLLAGPGPSNRPQQMDAAEATRRLRELEQPLPLPANLCPSEPGPSNRPQQMDTAEAMRRLWELEQPRVFDPIPYNPRQRTANFQDPHPHPDFVPPLDAAGATRRLRELEQPQVFNPVPYN